jgi:hypothetical protein
LGFGDTLGPAIGGFIYAFSGYVGTFVTFSGIILFGSLMTIFKMPAQLNKAPAKVITERNMELS